MAAMRLHFQRAIASCHASPRLLIATPTECRTLRELLKAETIANGLHLWAQCHPSRFFKRAAPSLATNSTMAFQLHSRFLSSSQGRRGDRKSAGKKGIKPSHGTIARKKKVANRSVMARDKPQPANTAEGQIPGVDDIEESLRFDNPSASRKPEFHAVIVGRPNVGKSTLFNRLVGKRSAIVYDQPGVTRDCKVEQAFMSERPMAIVDTAGLDETAEELFQGPNHWRSLTTEKQNTHLLRRAMDNTANVLQHQGDVAIFVLDAKTGVTPWDRHFLQWLRGLGMPTILAVNKIDAMKNIDIDDCLSLGLGNPVLLSAEHGHGIHELELALEPFFVTKELSKCAQYASKMQERPAKVAVIGKPNAGKSTFINALSKGRANLLVGPEPGITRDSVSTELTFEGKRVQLIDTAGMRRRVKVFMGDQDIEKLSVNASRAAIRDSDVVMLLLDGNELGVLSHQDMTLAQYAMDNAKPFVLVVNKTDTVPVEERSEVLRHLCGILRQSFTSVGEVQVQTMSAIKGRNVGVALKAALDLQQKAATELSTSDLNDWLSDWKKTHPVSPHSKKPKLKYAVQVGHSPITLLLFCKRAENVEGPTLRAITNNISEIDCKPADLHQLPQFGVFWRNLLNSSVL